MLCGLNAEEHAANSQAAAAAEGIRSALSKPFVLATGPEGKRDAMLEYSSTASIGVALFIDNEISQSEILIRADAAMYLVPAFADS
jgi:GGDEF domain-containing protein